MLALLLGASVMVTCVAWEDATGYTSGWILKDEIGDPATIISCGIYVKADKGHLYIAMDVDKSEEVEDGNVINGVGSIPLSIIKARKDIWVDLTYVDGPEFGPPKPDK